MRNKLTQSARNYQQQANLIELAIEKYGVSELFNTFLDTLHWQDKEKIKDRVKTEFEDDFRQDDKMNGFIILKIDNLEKKDKVENFLCNEIYPYYNEQQTELFN